MQTLFNMGKPSPSYFCFFKRDIRFLWGSLWPEAKPHLSKKFSTREEAERELEKVPANVRQHLKVTIGCDL